MTAVVLALAQLLAADARSDLTLQCDRCVAMEVDLDGEHLLHLDGLGGASVQAQKLGVAREARFTALPPGTHHLRVRLFQGTLEAPLAFDGPVYLPPGEKAVWRVGPGKLEDLTPPQDRPAPAGLAADGGAPTATLVVRADDAALCQVAVDGEPPLALQQERVVRSAPLAPGLHRVEVQTLRGARLSSGTLFVGAGEEVVAGVRCHGGAFQAYSDPAAFHPLEPDVADAGAPDHHR
jgi:hypothetical protein